MKSSLVQRIEREDLVMFVNAGFACTGQREFYGDAHGQRVSIGFLHEYILGNYRRLYARCLAAGLNHFNQALIISNLLATGDHTPRSLRAEEGELLFAALNALPTQRAYRVLAGLRERKINNRRTRAVVRRYLASRGDLTFDALKYRAKLRSAVAHCHLSLPGECGKFLFECRHQRRFETPLFESYRSARYSKSALYDLPFTVAEGFAARHGVSRAGFLREIEHQMTVGEKLRQQQAAARGQLSLQMDLGRVGLTRLASYALGLSVREREAARGRLEAAFEAAARRALRRSPQRLGRVAAILDRSYSSAGSSEKRRRPLAVAWAASRILRLAAVEYRSFWTPALTDELLLTPQGQTNLAHPLMEALEWGAELILIVSDGHENAPPHGAAELARVFRKRLDPKGRTSIIHLNPVFDAEQYAPHAMGAAIPTLGLRDAEDLLTMLGFARFADGSAPLSELETYLEARAQRLIANEHSGARDLTITT